LYFFVAAAPICKERSYVTRREQIASAPKPEPKKKRRKNVKTPDDGTLTADGHCDEGHDDDDGDDGNGDKDNGEAPVAKAKAKAKTEGKAKAKGKSKGKQVADAGKTGTAASVPTPSALDLKLLYEAQNWESMPPTDLENVVRDIREAYVDKNYHEIPPDLSIPLADFSVARLEPYFQNKNPTVGIRERYKLPNGLRPALGTIKCFNLHAAKIMAMGVAGHLVNTCSCHCSYRFQNASSCEGWLKACKK
jgi:hypothetical protein